MCFASCECRWFFEGDVDDEVVDWFRARRPWKRSYDLEPLEWPERARVDRYLWIPNNHDVGIKWRGDPVGGESDRLEIKGRVASLGLHTLAPGVTGVVERWIKWACGGEAVQASRVIDVEKRRILRKVRLDPETADIEVPVTGAGSHVERGLQIELTRLSVAGVTLLLAGALLVWRPWQGTSEQLPGGSPAMTSFSQVTQQPGSESNGDLSSDGRFVTYVSDAKGSDDIYLLRVGGRNPVNLTADSGAENRSPMFSPDGEFLVFRSSRDGGGLFIMGATGESIRRLTDHGHDPAWSPDGQRIAFVHEGTFDPAARTEESALWIVDSAGGEPEQIFAGDAMRPRWSPTGSRIVFWAIKDMELGSAQRDIASISVAGGEPVWLTEDEHLDWSPVWSPDGQYVYFLSDRGGSRNMWRIAVEESTGEAQSAPQPITVPSRSIDSLSISGDGTRILYTDLDRSANIVRVAVGADWVKPASMPVPVTGGSATYVDPQVSPDAQWVAFRNAGKQEDIYVVRSDGSDLRQLTDDAFRDRRPAWFPDGRTLVFYSNRTGRYEFWSISLDGSDLKQLTESTGESFFYPKISPNGTMLVATNEFTSAIWDLTGALPATESTPLPPIDAAGRSLFDPRWSRDGRSLVGFVFPEGGQGPFEGLALYSLDRSEYEVFNLESVLDAGALFWDREGRRIFFATVSDSTGSILHSLDPSSGEIRDLWPLAENTGDYDLAPSGDWLVFTQFSGEADLWLATLETP